MNEPDAPPPRSGGRGNGGAPDNPFRELLIGVTRFFRDPGEFAFLEREVIPKLFEGRQAGDHLRIWVPGCATGEEAYSVAILLREHMAKRGVDPHVRIFATDIDARALAVARVGRYPEGIIRDLSPERLARWFLRQGNTYCVAKDLREMCIFSSHNMVKDAPLARVDLISCRNLPIHDGSELRNGLIPLFHFSLRPGGYLFLAPSEAMTRHPELFAALDRRFRIFRRQETATRVLPELPLFTGGRRRDVDHGATVRPRSIDMELGKRAERIVERYAPAYVVVDEQHEVLHFSGRTGRYLDASSGAAGRDLLSLVHRDLRLGLGAALHRAVSERRTVHADRLETGLDGDRRIVDVTVEPIPGQAGEPLSLVVLFREGAGLHGERRDEADAGGAADTWFGAVTDSHERVAAGNRQGLLLAEWHHRVKNILAVVRSIAIRTLETSGSLEEFAAHFDGRLGALARTQNVGARTADGGIDLDELVYDELALVGGRDGEGTTISGPPVRLRAKTAETLGLALHELATNAVKYGALSVPKGGEIHVRWHVCETGSGPRLRLEWQESGVPVVDPAPHRSGFGRTLIEQGLPYELGAATYLEFGKGGIRCAIELPLNERIGTAVEESEAVQEDPDRGRAG